MSRLVLRTVFAAALVAALLALGARVTRAQGIVLNAAGPLNTAMAGASTAAPLDAMGALYWNPATITALPSSELAVSFELLLPQEKISSSYEANSFGPGVPPVAIEGSTRGEPGVTPIPNVGFVSMSEDSAWSYGLGVLAVGGFSVNYPASIDNPILTAQPPAGLGLGRVEARAEILQLVPTVAARLTERLSVGFAPTVTMARIAATPLCLGSPDDANGDGHYTYALAAGTRYHWGGGFQMGLFYQPTEVWNLGASLKSPQWLEDLRLQAVDELGHPVVHKYELVYPLMVSLGASYTGLERTILAIDVRYTDYTNANGFSGDGFLPTGALAGLGWESVWSCSLGAQRQLTERLAVQLGYWFSESPISATDTVFNVASPLFQQQVASAGFTFKTARCWELQLAYQHVFENSLTGPRYTPLGPVAGTSVTSTTSADALVAGISVRF